MRRKLAFLTFALALTALPVSRSSAAPSCPPGRVACTCDGISYDCLPPSVCAHQACGS